MKRAWLIARNDLRLFLRDKAGYFWLFGAPLLFAFFMGLNKGPGSPSSPKPSVRIENNDTNFIGKLFIEQLGTDGLRVVTNADGAQRGIRIPADFSANVLAKKPGKVKFFKLKDSQEDAALLVEARVMRTLIAMNSHLLELAGREVTEASMREVMKRPNPVELEVTFGSRKPIPAGYNQSIPGVLVMFVLMNLLIWGGATVASERREGVLRRFMAHPITKGELIFGKILALLGLGLTQIIWMLLVGAIAMNFRLGSATPLVLLTLTIYAWAAGSLGLLIGSLLDREDKIAGVCVLVTMVLAALGGCWWPLEIVPESVQRVAMLTPPAWAMSALHQVISFGGGLREITMELSVLTAFAAAASWAATKWFRV